MAGGSAKWRVSVGEGSHEPGQTELWPPILERGERGNWPRLVAAAPARPSEVDEERSETKPGRG